MNATDEFSTPLLDDHDIDRVLSALVDGLLVAEGRAQLEQQLIADPATRRRYLEFMQVEFLLAAEIGYGVVTGDRPPNDVGCMAAEPVVRGRRRPGFRGGAAAALLVGATVWAFFGWWRADRALSAPAARITAVENAVWADDWQPVVGERVAAGAVGLLAGTAQVTFASGAVVSIRAPAKVEVLGDNRLFVRSGRVTPYVPPAAKGFTVVSPSGEVVDFGTEFSIDVRTDGRTDVFVIDGEVAVAGGHGQATALQLTQGFASRFAAAGPEPAVTLRPLVVDHFDSAKGPLLREDCDSEQASVVRDGRLLLPIDGRPCRKDSMIHMMLGNDFSSLAGRRSVISYKATLPDTGAVHVGRWVAFVIDDGEEPFPPAATSSRARFGIMVSPLWQVGVRIAGHQALKRASVKVFSRAKDRVGPYQVVLEIDDSPAARAEYGSAVMTATVNGLEILRDQPFDLPARPRFSLHTWVRPEEGGQGQAVIDDFSVSVDASVDDGRTL